MPRTGSHRQLLPPSQPLTRTTTSVKVEDGLREFYTGCCLFVQMQGSGATREAPHITFSPWHLPLDPGPLPGEPWIEEKKLGEWLLNRIWT